MRIIWGLVGMLAAGCAPPAETGGDLSANMQVTPRDFALLPCPGADAQATCRVIAAGGKRVLLGAPAGAHSAMVRGDWADLDGVLLFSLHSDALEGLDTIRNLSWRAGRSQPLSIVGPSGIETVAEGLNQAFQTSDAIAFVDAALPGGFDTAVLRAKPAKPGDVVFDTGDLTVRAMPAAMPGELSYEVAYGEVRVRLERCRTHPGEVRMACAGAPIEFLLRGT